jgi:hypothetical protein
MIVWNAGRRFFPLKADADAHRKELDLPSSELFKIDIRDRDQLAEFLNGLCQSGEVDGPVPANTPHVPMKSDIPAFLKKAWAKLEAGWRYSDG